MLLEPRRNRRARLLAVLGLTLLLAPAAQANNGEGKGPNNGPNAFSKAIKQARDILFAAPWFEESQLGRGAAERQLQHFIKLATDEGFVVSDPLYPKFRRLSEHNQFGLSNPDNIYHGANILTPGEYVIRGRRGTSVDLQIQVGAGTPGLGIIGPTPISLLTGEDLVVEADGTFEIVISDTPTGDNWMAIRNDVANGTRVLVREAFSDWENQEAGTWYIERLDTRGTPNPVPTRDITTSQFKLAADYLVASAQTWVSFIESSLLQLPPNLMLPPRPTGGQGLPGQFSSPGKLVLEPGKAIVITMAEDPARYQAIQLADFWTNSFEFCSRQTSLTTTQAHRSSDGFYHMVVSQEDPGVANWLDPSGATSIFAFIRWQSLPDGYVFPLSHYPRAVVVDVDDLESVLPADDPDFGPEDRIEQLAARRAACLSDPRGF